MDLISLLGIPAIVAGVILLIAVWWLFSYVPLRLWVAAALRRRRISTCRPIGSGRSMSRPAPAPRDEPGAELTRHRRCEAGVRSVRHATVLPIATERGGTREPMQQPTTLTRGLTYLFPPSVFPARANTHGMPSSLCV